MSFVVSDRCRQLGLRSGALLFRDVRIGTGHAELRADIVRGADEVRKRFTHADAIRSDPAVVAFQEILRQVDINPRRDKPSLERLLAFAHKRSDLPAINDLVDAYNLVSIRTGCSIGAHDLDHITLPVALRFLTGAETFTALGEREPRSLDSSEFAYVDGAARVLCRLDILQADFSKVTPETRNVLLIVEGTAWHAAEVLDRAFEDVQTLITRYCGGTAEVLQRAV